MNFKIIIVILSIVLITNSFNIKRILQKDPNFDQHHGNAFESQDDPFSKKTSPQQGKKRNQGSRDLPLRQERSQQRGIYKPFDEKQEHEEMEQNKGTKDSQYIENFNEMLTWGMIIGSCFLSFVLIKTCIRKRGRRQVRKYRENMLRMNPNLIHQGLSNSVNQVYIPENQNQTIDQKIRKYQIQLNKLKEMKQQGLKRQFEQKKMEQQRRRKQACERQRSQQIEFKNQRNHQYVHPRYGPNFYGQPEIQLSQNYQQSYQPSPFQVKGAEVINRKRSNSFKTQVSEQPILYTQNKFRNGIPIGKPLKQDNDSSFASEYPQV